MTPELLNIDMQNHANLSANLSLKLFSHIWDTRLTSSQIQYIETYFETWIYFLGA